MTRFVFEIPHEGSRVEKIDGRDLQQFRGSATHDSQCINAKPLDFQPGPVYFEPIPTQEMSILLVFGGRRPERCLES